MQKVLTTLVGVVVSIGAAALVFIAAYRVFDLVQRHFARFTAIAGALGGLMTCGLLVANRVLAGGVLALIAGALVGGGVGYVLGRRWTPSYESRSMFTERARVVMFLAPALLFIFVALVAPTIRTAYLSLRTADGNAFLGLGNYRWMVTNDEIFGVGGFSEVFASRLLWVGLLLALVGFVLARRAGRRIGVLFDFAGTRPATSTAVGVALVTLAVFAALAGPVVWNNLWWVVAVTTLSTGLGLAIAVLADKLKYESLAKSLVFLPMAISFVGASVIWRFMYASRPAGEEQFGLVNAVLTTLGNDPYAFLVERPWNTFFLIVVMIWMQTGFAMVVLSAAIKAVPEDIVEAARVDGAGEGDVFWRIVIPSIRGSMAVVVTTLVILVMKVYDIVKVMTNGEFATNVIANEMFDQAFRFRQFGRGSALATLLFVAVLPLMVLNIRRTRKEAMLR